MKLIAEGAEAKIYLENDLIIKERIPKDYRIKTIDDSLRKSRTRKELKILDKASNIINVPKLHSSSSEKDFKIVMEFIDGKKLAESLDSFSDKERVSICHEVGKQAAIMHNNNIIHGDLTTSNMILKDKVLEVIYLSVDAVNEFLPQEQRIEKREDTVLFDKSSGSSLDSMGMVNLIVALEENIQERIGKAISIAEELNISEENNPFQTVDTLLAGLTELLERK